MHITNNHYSQVNQRVTNIVTNYRCVRANIPAEVIGSCFASVPSDWISLASLKNQKLYEFQVKMARARHIYIGSVAVSNKGTCLCSILA